MSVRPEIESLLQARVDGTLTETERAELNRLLATDRDVRLRAAEIDALAEMIDSLGDVDPPAGMTDQIISAILDRDDDRHFGHQLTLHDTAAEVALTACAAIRLPSPSPGRGSVACR